MLLLVTYGLRQLRGASPAQRSEVETVRTHLTATIQNILSRMTDTTEFKQPAVADRIIDVLMRVLSSETSDAHHEAFMALSCYANGMVHFSLYSLSSHIAATNVQLLERTSGNMLPASIQSL